MTGTMRHPSNARARPNCDCSRDRNAMLQNPLFDVPMTAELDAPHTSRRVTACPITTLVHQMAASLGFDQAFRLGGDDQTVLAERHDSPCQQPSLPRFKGGNHV